MSARQDFAALIDSQNKIWCVQIKDYEERLKQGSKQPCAEYKKAVAQMQTNAEEAHKLLEKVQGISESAWNDVHNAVREIFVELQKDWADAVSRFK